MKHFEKCAPAGDGRVFRSGVYSTALAAAVVVLALVVGGIVLATVLSDSDAASETLPDTETSSAGEDGSVLAQPETSRIDIAKMNAKRFFI